ncbi:MAG: glucans biosynthesis glucosyltransferase MdoH [Pseudazoarcus pumilus]|nr:glucans biosynthesis glucosyltransferase MdoH [Pseudazoarcus pumilus]
MDRAPVLRSEPTTVPRVKWRLQANVRRFLLTAVVITQTVFATDVMRQVLPYQGGNWVEIGLIALFALMFTWISVGFWIGMTGFVLRRFGGDPRSLLRRRSAAELDATVLARTAIVMPIYHEPVERTLGGLRAIYRSLERTGKLADFDFYILSDSRAPGYWMAEKEAWFRMCNELGAAGRLFYRRRTLNMNYKSGNIADFLRRWGRRYEYMIVLDADSLMEGDTLVKLVQLMQLEPQVGLIQTNPVLVNAKSLFARAQQFANQVYGPLFSTGLAAFQLGEAAYWGHNAIMRIRPFMDHCGLPKMRGFGLFKGPIASHDFVESAYMARAGHEVWLEPGLGGSYEESPPTVVDELTRDKRWAKGNLQHLWVLLTTPRLRWAHRMAFINGIMSYCASPLWLAFLALSTISAARLVLQPIEYFPQSHSLFPQWPQWDPLLALKLVASTLFLLFFPKMLSVIDVLLSRRRTAHGGFFRLMLSVNLEMLVSTLLAPIRMLAHSRYVIEALLNVSLRWAGQNRGDETSWQTAIASQAPGSLLAAAWAWFAWTLDPMFFYWSLPVAIPLILAAPTSVLFSRVGPGQTLRKAGLLLVPQERSDDRLIDEMEHGAPLGPRQGDDDTGAFVEAIIDPMLNRMHADAARGRAAGAKREHLRQLCGRCLLNGPSALTPKQLSLLAQDRESLLWLHRSAWRAPSDSFWGRELYTRSRSD